MAGVRLGVSVGTLTDAPDGSGNKEVKLSIKLEPTESGSRTPSDVVCVLDTSGSMGMEATIAGEGGKQESHGLSLLDVAKHGVRTMANALGSEDRLAVVDFSHVASTVFGLTKMDEAGKKLTEDKLEDLSPGGGTNIWEGLIKGLECLEKEKQPGRFGHIMLLTDGETQGRDTVIPNIMDFKAKHEGLPGSINTFGFGYNLDSKLLCQMATAGMGSYSFIPDAGFVGTAFVNMLSTLLATMARDVAITVEKGDGITANQPWGGWEAKPMGDFYTIEVGSMQFGQSKDVVLPLVLSPEVADLAIGAKYTTKDSKTPTEAESQIVKVPADKADDIEVERQYCRGVFVDVLKTILDEMATGGVTKDRMGAMLAKLSEAIVKIEASPAASDPDVQALLEDAKGQSTEAVSREDWYQKWGCHYLPSVMFAHKLQMCNNFKDPGVQVYGKGTLFSALRDEADDIFCKIPAPKPTARRSMGYSGGYGGGSSAPRAPVSMAAYHDSSGVCVDGSSLVRLAGGEMRRVDELARGDRVAGAEGAEAVEVRCLVRTACAGGRAALVELSPELRLTPNHPVLVDGVWRFPAELGQVEERPCEAVYSFLLEGSSAMSVGGIQCAALGHGIDAGAAAHPYFSTQQVAKDLAALPSFKDGLVDLAPGSVLRDPATGLVCGLAAPPDAE